MRRDVTFEAGGVKLAGWLVLPDGGKGPHPLIVMSHGFTAIKAMGLDEYAQVFQKAGLACLVYDHRNYAGSAGAPRHESDPWAQVRDMRDAITYARSLPEVDGERIGIWGTSYSGGHVLVVGALDRRVKCVVSQVPLVSGYATFTRWITADRMPGMLEKFAKDREARARGEAPKTVKAAHEGSETAEWAAVVDKDGAYANEVTLRSMEMFFEYEPGVYIERIAPTPLLMIVAGRDTTTPTDTQLDAFNRLCFALGPVQRRGARLVRAAPAARRLKASPRARRSPAARLWPTCRLTRGPPRRSPPGSRRAPACTARSNAPADWWGNTPRRPRSYLWNWTCP